VQTGQDRTAVNHWSAEPGFRPTHLLADECDVFAVKYFVNLANVSPANL
jgi:hypothetical protein